MTLLAIETSCDETSAAVVRQGRILANEVSSQIQLHAEYGGVVPELAAREHLKNLPLVVRAALDQAGVSVGSLDALAATRGPGLPNALLVGFKAGQGMAFALRKPFLGIHHHEAHLYSPWIAGSPPAAEFDAFQPNVSLVVSGGHTILAHVKSESDYEVLGSTIDDAAGECFDKVAKMMGLGYPGGPEIDRLAAEGEAGAFAFPRPMLREPGEDFSFSGLKTAVLYFIRDRPKTVSDPKLLRDLCAGVQAAIIEVLTVKTIRAARRLGVGCVTASGGVTCNRGLRRELEAGCRREGLALRLAERPLCTDNAAMIGILAERKLERGEQATALDAEIAPGWPLEEAHAV